MKASTLRTVTQFPLLPNRVVRWVENQGKRIDYPNTPTIVPDYSRSIRLEIRNYHEWIQQNIYFRGFYEIRETKIIKQYLSFGDTFIDVGANIGWFSLSAAPIVGSAGKVIAFEPFNEAYDLLKRNVEINNFNNIKLEKSALSNKKGETTLSILKGDHQGSGSLVRNPESSNIKVEKVQTITLDDYFRENNIKRAKFIKIDVEGAEMLVLQGMREILEKKACDYLIVEVCESASQSIGVSSTEVLKFLQNCGYSLYSINYIPFNMFRFEPLRVDKKISYANIIAQRT